MHILFHGQTDQNILMIHDYGIRGVLIGKKDACLGIFNICPIEIDSAHRISVDVPDAILVFRIVEEEIHFV